MDISAYYEANQKVNKKDAVKLEKLIVESNDTYLRYRNLRKLLFTSASDDNKTSIYRMEMEDFDPQKITLHQIWKQKNITYDRAVHISMKNAMKILEADYNWLSEEKNEVLQSFYREIQWNHLKPVRILEMGEMIYKERGKELNIRTSVRSIGNTGYKFFDPNIYMISCLNENEVELYERKSITIPNMIGQLLSDKDENNLNYYYTKEKECDILFS